MKKRNLARVLFCSGLHIVGPWSLIAQGSSPLPDHPKPLTVKITDTKQQLYCKNQTDLFTVYIKTKLTITNTSSRSVILPKAVLPVLRVRISTSLREAQQGKFVYDPNSYEVSEKEVEVPRFGSVPDPTLFITLKPGEKYATSTWAGLLADLSTKQNSHVSGMTSGNFLMQLYIRTWSYGALSDAEFESVKTKWIREGDLLNDVIGSNFYPISLPVSPTSPSCDSFRAPTQH